LERKPVTYDDIAKRWPPGPPFLTLNGFTFFRRGFVAAADNPYLVDICLAWPQFVVDSADAPKHFFYAVVGNKAVGEYKPGAHFPTNDVRITIDTPAWEIEREIDSAKWRLILYVATALNWKG